MKPPVRNRHRLILVALALFAVAPLCAGAQGTCLLSEDPIPLPPLGRPAAGFDSEEYSFVHSSTHLQGQPSTEKLAPGLFYLPPGVLGNFSSAVVVNNPSPTLAAAVTIQYYDSAGNPVQTSNVTVPAEGTHVESASALTGAPAPGQGSARITSDIPIVGATLHHSSSINGCSDPDPGQPGASAMQQLQVDTGASDLWWGPIPVSVVSPIDFLNGLLPFFSVMNPGPNPTNVTVTIHRPPAPPVVRPPVTIPANGSHVELFMWNRLANYYATQPTNTDRDIWIHVQSDNGAPLIGEGILADSFGNSPGNNLVACDKLRMTSSMMANRQAQFLLNPELVSQTAGPVVRTAMGITNVSNADVGPVLIEYYNRNGVLLGADTQASMPAFTSLRIGPGLAGSPAYPLGPVFAGWARVIACAPGLIGHTMREITATDPTDYEKAYGETLKGTNVQEPGPGFEVLLSGVPYTRKVIPFSRVSPSFVFPPFWPGYSTFVNPTTPNIGPYFIQFFDLPGTNVTNFLNQPFAGLPWGNTSFTYEDPETLVPFTQNVSGRVDHTSGRIEGIDVIGDPLIEFDIGCFPAQPDCFGE